MYQITIFSFLKTGQYVYFTFLEILFVLYLAIKKKNLFLWVILIASSSFPREYVNLDIYMHTYMVLSE